MRTKHVLAVLIGRFQFFHEAHFSMIDNLVGKVDSALVLVGSAYRPRSWKNPLSFDERRALIRKNIQDIDLQVDVLPLVDTLYNDRSWSANVRTAVRLYIRAAGLREEDVEIVLTGFEKDKSSRYLSWFPEWKMLPAPVFKRDDKIISATDLREALFFPGHAGTGQVAARFGVKQVSHLMEWMKANPEACDSIRSEGLFQRKSREAIERAEAIYGYPIPINTADAVVVQSGHVLLVRRAQHPGKGTLALPGGHILRDETALDAAIRNLKTETRIDMPKGAIQGRLRDRRVFDHPERSERGWVRTEAFFFELQDRQEMEKVRTVRDADDLHVESVAWVPLSEVTPDEMFEDHFDIIQSFVSDVSMSYSSILMPAIDDIRSRARRTAA